MEVAFRARIVIISRLRANAQRVLPGMAEEPFAMTQEDSYGKEDLEES
jgi:hypothetical protein